MAETKIFSLRQHQASHNGAEILLGYQTDFSKDDVVELYSEKNEDRNALRILLKISDAAAEDLRKDTLSIIETICNIRHFRFQNFQKIGLRKVDPQSVTADLVVLTCKDTYLSRSDMWLLKKELEKNCVYLEKKISFFGQNTQIIVSEVWRKGHTQTCGYVDESTRICYRSSTAAIHIFIQMSAEMWQYDSYGDLYFEKAVNGFLTDLFSKWKAEDCCHDVTIVLFSRTFYEASTLEEFPVDMREGVQNDNAGRFYEDFYRVVVQNERYDDWTTTLMKLKRLFISYDNDVCRRIDGAPPGHNSAAAQGNFLEVLNMSLNVYEKYYIDRNFDRLGKTAMIITPGPGVFEVDRELVSVTKHRTIDSGCAADLICMGEQPLHAVPLFKQFQKNRNDTVSENYRIPHTWINHSFYTSQCQIRVASTSKFISRIKQANRKVSSEVSDMKESLQSVHNLQSFDLGDDMDYDAYDKDVFRKIPSGNSHMPKGMRYLSRKSSGYSHKLSSSLIKEGSEQEVDLEKIPQASTVDALPDYESRHAFSQASSSSDNDDEGSAYGSADTTQSTHYYQRAVDPFMPGHVKSHMTPNKRRWVHTFPLDENGVEIQPHHVSSTANLMSISSQRLVTTGRSRMKLLKKVSIANEDVFAMPEANLRLKTNSSESLEQNSPKTTIGMMSPYEKSGYSSGDNMLSQNELKWDPVITGVDWRSLTTPALLPITTDYFPDKSSLESHYEDQVYTLDPLFESPLNYAQFFMELVNTRLSLGFQLVMQGSKRDDASSNKRASSQKWTRIRPLDSSNEVTYRLSIGRLFHQLSFQDSSTITVKVQKPKSKRLSKQPVIQYKYKFRCPDSEAYTVSLTDFSTEQLEVYNWNYIDNYVINGGNTREQILVESCKYWRTRLCLLPISTIVKSLSDQIKEKASTPGDIYCDLFCKTGSRPSWLRPHQSLCDGFIRFLEMLNDLKRERQNTRKQERKSGHTIDVNISYSRNQVDLECERLAEFMLDSRNGMSFFAVQESDRKVPSGTFISYECIQWMMKHVQHVETTFQAELALQKLINEKYVQRLADSSDSRMHVGFFLYTISAQPAMPLTSDSFQEFVFVEVQFGLDTEGTEDDNFQLLEEMSAVAGVRGYASVSINWPYRSDRVEWGSIQHCHYYDSDCAYDFELAWIVATGMLLSDMVNTYSRKVHYFGFHLVPIPVDPFALPRERNSDPLRGPIFVPVNHTSVREFSMEKAILFLIQIAQRFGFVPISYIHKDLEHTTQLEFVHCSGGFFVLIDTNDQSKLGFHWSWNKMLTKRWWSASSGDECFQDHMLADFRNFCANDGSLRLHLLWQEMMAQ